MGKIGWKVDYCWVVTALGLGPQPDLGKPMIKTYATKWAALQDFPELVEKLKRKYPRIQWKEDIGNLNSNRITEYKIEAATNPYLYVRAFKSNLE